MDLNMNPEPTRRLKALFETPTPSGYEPPILGVINQVVNNIAEQRDNAIMVQIRDQIRVDVDKNELIRALNYDRNQFNEGYRKGYRDAKEKYEESDRWIPVSERLPEEMGTYLVTLEYKEHGKGITTLWYHGKQIGWDLRVADVVIAWKPLPKPYESEDSE